MVSRTVWSWPPLTRRWNLRCRTWDATRGTKWVKRRCQILEKSILSTISYASLQVVGLKKTWSVENVHYMGRCWSFDLPKLNETTLSITTREKQPKYSSLQWTTSSPLPAVAEIILSRAPSFPITLRGNLMIAGGSSSSIPALACSSRNAAYFSWTDWESRVVYVVFFFYN